MKHRLVFLCALLLSVPLCAFAQSPLEADAAAFRYDTNHAEVEIDYGVLQRALAFKQTNGVWTAITHAKAEIWQNGAIAQTKDIHDTVQCPCTQAQFDSAGANKLLGATAFAVPYGDTTTAAFLWRAGEKNGNAVYDTIVIPLRLPDRDTQKFVLAGIELSSQVAPANGVTSPFEKAGYIVTPNPSGIFGENYTKLYYYTELYVPQSAVDPAQSADVITSVVDGTGRVILTSTDKVPLAGAVIPLILGLDIDGLASDSYRLRVQVKSQDAVVAETGKTFYYASDLTLQQAPPPAPAGLSTDSVPFDATDFAKLDEAGADLLIEQSMYWGNDNDRNLARKEKTLVDKQHFLYAFWLAQDAKRNSVRPLDAYRTFMKRLNEANTKYTFEKTPGWKTGRGKVLIVYGPPVRVDDEYYTAGYKPYTIWQYDPDPTIHLQPGSGNFPEFDFVDRMGGGNYSLVSSNVIGQTYDPNWLTTEALRLAH